MHAHHDVQDAGHFHVSAAPQHSAAQDVELESRKRQGIDQEVERGVAPDRRVAAQPRGQHPADGSACGGQKEAEHAYGHEGLAQDGLGPFGVVGAYGVSHLDGKARGGGRTQARKQPSGSGHQADGGRGFRSQASYHGGIDVLHGDGGELGHDGRDAEQHGEMQLLP